MQISILAGLGKGKDEMDTALSPQAKDETQTLGNKISDSSKSPMPFHYHGEIPQFVGAEMERLYGNLYSSLPHLSIEGRLGDASTYVVRDQGRLTVVFLYQVNGSKVQVLNEVINVSRAEITQFSKYIFHELKHVDLICFRAIHTDIRAIPLKVQRYNYLEDMVICLPGSEDDYASMLSPKTRSNVRRKMKSIKADHPSFEIKFFEKEDIQEAHVLALIEFNRARMQEKKKRSAYATAESERLIHLAKKNGVMTLCFIDGRICGGIINYRVGENYFCLLLTHDPKYNEYSLGVLCNYRAICEAIQHGARELHFLWGRYHYKYALLALPRELDLVVIYRSRFMYLLNLDMAVKAYAMWLRREFSLWKHHQKQNKGVFYRLAKFSLN
jgi:hypothetical protein